MPRTTLKNGAQHMPTFTLGTAAQATGTAKSTILRAIKAGRLSAARTEDGSWSIDPVELNRCFSRCLPFLAHPRRNRNPNTTQWPTCWWPNSARNACERAA